MEQANKNSSAQQFAIKSIISTIQLFEGGQWTKCSCIHMYSFKSVAF